jgi:hypothetical protein
MLRSIVILMLVAFMASVGFFYENQAGGSQAPAGSGIDHRLVAATVIRQASGNPVQHEFEFIEAMDSTTSLVNTAAVLKRRDVMIPFGASVYPAFCILDDGAGMDE